MKEFSGKPVISGEEKERMNENNQYDPAWKSFNQFKSLSNLFPKEAKDKVKNLMVR